MSKVFRPSWRHGKTTWTSLKIILGRTLRCIAALTQYDASESRQMPRCRTIFTSFQHFQTNMFWSGGSERLQGYERQNIWNRCQTGFKCMGMHGAWRRGVIRLQGVPMTCSCVHLTSGSQLRNGVPQIIHSFLWYLFIYVFFLFFVLVYFSVYLLFCLFMNLKRALLFVHLFNHSPVVLHKAVAEVSKVRNL